MDYSQLAKDIVRFVGGEEMSAMFTIVQQGYALP